MRALTKVIHPVRDLAAAKAVYAALLGVEPTMDESYYVGFDIGDQHLGLDPHGHAKGMTGPVGYWNVDDIEKSVTSLTGAGATLTSKAQDVGGGTMVATLTDADGNPIGLIQLSTA
jgi:predicted enzyme related to lactoylglutathione lyase